MVKVKFTENEATVLLHRLYIPECISEALTDYDPATEPKPKWTKEEVEECAIHLGEELLNHNTITIKTELEREIMEDVADGNTYGCDLSSAKEMDGRKARPFNFGIAMTAGQAKMWTGIIKRLNDKLEKKLGLKSTIPMG